jgi:hypothetical protein
MKRSPILSLAAGLLFLSGCEQPTAKPEASDAQIQLSAEMSRDLFKTLGPQLKNAMQAGGAERAVEVCQQIAQPLTESISEKYPGARISRVALRYRNPANAADPASASVLKEWEAKLAAGDPLPTNSVTETEGNIIVHQPIMTQELCLQCHGAPGSFSPELTQILAQSYPGDRATGYQVGDLRGAFRIEFPSTGQ